MDETFHLLEMKEKLNGEKHYRKLKKQVYQGS